MPSRGFDVHTVDSTVVSPTLTMTAPSARLAKLAGFECHLEAGGIDGTADATTESIVVSLMGGNLSVSGAERIRFPVVSVLAGLLPPGARD